MAVKTFTTGEVLTASDTNTYLANAGLVYITQATLAAAATVNVDNCFSSTYTNYVIKLWEIDTSAAGDVYFQIRGGTTIATNYYWTRIGYSQFGASDNYANNDTKFYLGYTDGTPKYTAATIEVFQPNEAFQTKILSQFVSWNGASADMRNASGFHDLATAYTGFSITSSVATVGCKVAVYGVRGS